MKNEDAILRLPSLESQLAAWIVAADKQLVRRNLTLKRSGFKAYVRRSRRLLDDVEVTTLDIASIEIPTKCQGRGWFRQFRRIAEALNPWGATFYESVLNPRLEAYFKAEGLPCIWENCFYVMHPDRQPLSAEFGEP